MSRFVSLGSRAIRIDLDRVVAYHSDFQEDRVIVWIESIEGEFSIPGMTAEELDELLVNTSIPAIADRRIKS